MLKLARLKIGEFRDVTRGSELFFGDGKTVLLGRNGTGKTTLLDLIAMILRDDFTPIETERFSFDYDLAFEGHPMVSVRVSNQPATSRSADSAREIAGERVDLDEDRRQSTVSTDVAIMIPRPESNLLVEGRSDGLV